MNVSRDDFVIAIRSAFLKKQTKQKFSLLSLIILSIITLILSSFDYKVVKSVRSGINEVIYRGSFIISAPEKIIKNINYEIRNHFGLYNNSKKLEEELDEYRSQKISLDILEFENQKLRQQLDDYLVSTEIVFSKIIIDNKSPFLRSLVINKGSRDGIKSGMAVLDQQYLVGKVIEVNFGTSRVLLLSDINSNIPITISPGNLLAIASGTGKDQAKVNFLKKTHFDKITNESLVYSSGTGGLIKSGVPIGRISNFDPKIDENIDIEFFSDFSQLQYVSVVAFDKVESSELEKIDVQTSEIENDILLDAPALRKKLDLLLKEKEINDQITNKIKLENESLKSQLSNDQLEKINKQKIIEEQNKIIKSHNIDKDELNFLRLNLEYGEKCRKKTFSKKGFKVGTPEYKNCVLRKGML
ncbi:MAG: rod shape-determining protein MreC [Pelagibacterales bacterium MED-G44]|nr:MAG: rod shape-determining protein MreC [Pelagibacterales bacterium MED-G44]